jgi:hypothetical protein
MPQLAWPVLRSLGAAIAERADDGLADPLPKRWVELIHVLNERERADSKGLARPPNQGKGGQHRKPQ